MTDTNKSNPSKQDVLDAIAPIVDAFQKRQNIGAVGYFHDKEYELQLTFIDDSSEEKYFD